MTRAPRTIAAALGVTALFASAPGTGVWPLDPRPSVVQPFQPPAVRWGAGHRGVDLLAVPGQVVRAPLPGQVAFTGSVAGTPVVTLEHPDGRRTTYQPAVTTARVGDPVGRGAPFALVAPGSSHCAPALCMHWGLKDGKTYLDPLSLVMLPRIRLLPLDGS